MGNRLLHLESNASSTEKAWFLICRGVQEREEIRRDRRDGSIGRLAIFSIMSSSRLDPTFSNIDLNRSLSW